MNFPLSEEQIRRLDASDMLARLTSMPHQLAEAMEIVSRTDLRWQGGNIRNVLVAGVGGSAIGGDLLRNYLVDVVDVPILVNREYELPAFVGPDTVVLACSYSGNTEETLAAYREALRRKAQIVIIASGGQLARLAAQEAVPLILIPSGFPPRAALGYSFTALLMSLYRLGVIENQEKQLREAQNVLFRSIEEYGLAVPLDHNRAKQVALKIHRKLPIIYAWGHRLEVVALRWRAQLAENSKQLSSHHLFPEMNHNEIVGWGGLGEFRGKLVVLLLRDGGEPGAIQKRMEITKELIAPFAAEIVEIEAGGKTRLARLFFLICLGDYVSFYLAMLNGVDPTPVERIEELKTRLAGDSESRRKARKRKESW